MCYLKLTALRGKKWILCHGILVSRLNWKLSNLWTRHHTRFRYPQIPSIDSRSVVRPKQTINSTEVTNFCFGHINSKQVDYNLRITYDADKQFGCLRALHTSLEKFKNVALCLLLGLPSTFTNSHENEAFRERSSNRWHHDNHKISRTEFSSNTNPKWPVIVAFSNFPGVVSTESILCVFRVKAPFSNFAGLVCTGSK